MTLKIYFVKKHLYDLIKDIQEEINKGYILTDIVIDGYSGRGRYDGELSFVKKGQT